MNSSTARATTVTTGMTVLAIAAIAALLLSAFAFVRPTAATHDGGFDHQPLPIDTSTFAHDDGECEDVDLSTGEVLLHFVATQQNTTDAITLSLSYAAGGSVSVDSTKWNEPGQINSNVTHHFYVIVDGDVLITDLDISTGEGNVRLSHVCRADGEQPAEDDDAALNIFKLIENTTTRLPGAVFEIDGMDGTFVTDENGQICITGLPEDSEWLVREIQAPEGYEIIEAEQLVEVDNDGDCDSPDARFYNRPLGGELPGDDEAGIVILKVDEQDGPLAGAVFTVEGVEGEFTTGTDGRVCVDGLPDDTMLTVTEIQAPAGYVIADPASQQVETDDDGCDQSPEVTFVNEVDEGEQPAETSQVEIMKHFCADISTVAEFEAIEAAAREEVGSTGLEENEDFAALAATVVNCPTIILSADVPMDENPMAAAGDFEFTVLDATGTQVLSTDGLFVDNELCETDIAVDVNNNGSFDSGVCLDTSYYRFEVVDGIVTITETVAPGGEGFFGTIRFTPGSGDEMALVGSIDAVEQSDGVITLNTTLDPDNSGEGTPDEYAADLIMVHVYNFSADEGAAPDEDTQGGNPTPREDTQGGNPTPREDTQGGTLPDTATPAGHGSLPAALLALLLMTGLGVAGHRAGSEVRRRR